MVSIVIPTLGRDSLHDLIKSLPSSPQIEVLVVLDSLKERDLAENLARRWPNVIFKQASKPGVNCARNFGAHSASHEVVWFLDDDVSVPDGLTAQLLFERFADPNLIAMGGGYLTPNSASAIERGYNLLSSMWRYTSGENENEAFLGGCLAIRKTVFKELGGFDESIEHGGAETQFVHELRRWSKARNHVLRYEQGLDVFHRPGNRRFAQWFDLAFRQGRRAAKTDKMRPPSEIRRKRIVEFMRRLSPQEKIVLAAFCMPYLGITRLGRLFSTLRNTR